MVRLAQAPVPPGAEQVPPPGADGRMQPPADVGPAEGSRLQALPELPAPFAATPQPSAEVRKEFDHFVQSKIDPQETLDLVVDRPRVLVLTQAPKRVVIPDETVATYNVLSETQIAVVGKKSGSTVLNLWFADAERPGVERVLSYLVRVIPDPEAKARLDRVYQALAAEINREFPDSHVELAMVGDKLLVRGEAKDALDATQILTIIRANAPGQQGGGNAAGGGLATVPIGNMNMFMNQQSDQGNEMLRDELGPDAPGAVGVQNYLLRGNPFIINLLRVPGEQQVMLKVIVAEVNRTAARSIGVNFAVANKAGQTVFGQFTGGLISGTTSLGGTTSNSSIGGNLPAVLDNGQIGLAIQALRTLSMARSLAEPNLVTINGRPAQFHAGGQFPVPQAVVGVAVAGQGVTFIPFGVSLTFTPYITDRDRIRLQVYGQVSATDNALAATIGSSGVGTSVPGLQSRTFSSTLELREGQTLAVAGLLQNNLTTTSTRVPFFGDLPLLGRLASYDTVSNQEFELVMLITPQLVHPLEHDELPPLPGADIFEPGDIEFFLLTRLESRRNYDFRSPVRTDFGRLLRYQHCQDVLILGPHGHSDDTLPPGK